MSDHPIENLKWLAEIGADEALAESPVDRFLETQIAIEAANKVKSSPKFQNGNEELNSRIAAPKQNSNAVPAKLQSERQKATLPDDATIDAARQAAQSANSLDDLKSAISKFKGCNLAINAKHVVFNSGNPNSDIMIIGEAPDREEDSIGEPFGGSGGLLLDKMLSCIGLQKDETYLTTALPWHTPGSRPPTPAELQLCAPFIIRQIELLRPKLLILLGSSPAKIILKKSGQIHTVRGKWQTYQNGEDAIASIISLHPSFLLKHPAQKNLAWQDLLQIKAKLAELKR